MMAASSDCNQNSDPLKLIRVGTSQDQRLADALNPAKPDFPRIDERRIEHAMVFAKAYAAHLQFYGPGNTITGTWEPFFSRDVSVQLAVAAIQSTDDYRNGVKTSFDFLKSGKNQNSEAELKQHLGYLFSYAGSLAQQLDVLKEALPKEIALKSILQNLVQRQLAPAFRRLVAYYNADLLLAENDRLIADDAEPGVTVLGARTAAFSTVYAYSISKDWMTDNASDWQTYTQSLPPDSSVFGTGATVFERINPIATHNLFTSIFDQFLKAFARTVSEAQNALAASFTDRDDHEPHYALFVSFLRLFNHVRTETDTLTQRHLDFYYRQILRLKEKPAEPSRAHLLAELAKHADSHEIPEGALFKAGKDSAGVDAFFANDRAFIANKATVTERKNLYRHSNTDHDTLESENGRLFAAPVADSEDGLGAKLTSVDQSWHPFFNKVYKEGELDNINMPKAEIGFAVASHYLLLAEGERTITLTFTVDSIGDFSADPADIACLFSGEEGWLNAPADWFKDIDGKQLQLQVKLDGAMPKVAPYSAKIHGFGFKTELPVMRVLLNHRSDTDFIYAELESIRVQRMDLAVTVTGLKTLALSNDFGPIDASKPFQPFGATPGKNSSLVVGSKEAFQKELSLCKLNVVWQATPAPYDNKSVSVSAEFLQKGRWFNSGIAPINITQTVFDLTPGLNNPYTPSIDAADLSEQESYSSADRHGYVRLKTNEDFGQRKYEQDLIDYIAHQINTEQTGSGNTKKEFVAGPAINQVALNNQITSRTEIDLKPTPPTGPFIAELTLEYTATQTLVLNAAEPTDFEARKGHFLHLTPFGHAEQHGFLKINAPDTGLYLLPQFSHINSAQKSGFDPDLPDNQLIRHEAEFYLGVSELKPPQNLALLFQVADGTADPLSDKPDPHIHWSFLSSNEWLPFDEYTIEDATSELLNSGIITLAVPEAATSDNTLMPSGQHWLRASVAKESDAVCRLQMVAAQGFTTTFKNQDNDPSFTAAPLAAGTVSKLEKPDAAVKGISQPFPSFGGRGAEQAPAFYTRISERLRHKDRAIALWDYERLLLQAFPQIFQAKCLNHTHYEPDTGGGNGIYRELAPGHVTVVTIPNLALHTRRDPLRPYTGLGLLEDIGTFLSQRLSGFVTLHLENPLFEEVGVSFKVRFHEGYDETFYANQLDEAITRFLSPWAFPGGGNPSFGGKIYRSVLLNFVEEQMYVDYVTDFKLSHSYQRFDDYGAITDIVIADAADVQGSKGVSLLVSARQHSIDVLNPVSETAEATCPCASV
jgi:hypothetical protein